MFFADCAAKYEGAGSADWLLAAMKGRGGAFKTLSLRYETNQAALVEDIKRVCAAVGSLPCFKNQKLRLPVFAAKVTKDPHAFDLSTGAGQLLIYALMHHFGEQKPENAEQRAELYYKAGILPDGVSSYVITACPSLPVISARTGPLFSVRFV